MANYISIANRKGGVGKSTLLALTATAIHARTDRRVLAIDADLQESIHHQRLQDAQESDAEGFDIVPFSFAKQTDADVPILRFLKLIREVDPKYDVVFIDAPGTMEGEVIPTILTVSDTVIIPVIGSVLDINSTISFLSLVEDVNAQRDHDLQVIGVINKKDQTLEYGQLDALEGVAGLHLMQSSIRNRVEYRRLSTLEQLVTPERDHEFNDYLHELSQLINF